LQEKTILVAPLNWGLGHATRCIPIIKALLDVKYKVILASDGAALLLLRKEFPHLSFIELPSYDITYPKKGEHFKWKLLWKLPHIQRTITSEKKLINKMATDGTIHGIISDNRLGVFSKKIPTVFITHQLKVLSGKTSFISSKVHQMFIKKFNECWVPDVEESINLSGKLGHIKNSKILTRYIGPISRFQKKELPKKYDILALISGPEPQRSSFEKKLIKELSGKGKKVLVVRGVIEPEQQKTGLGNVTIVNYMKSDELEAAINESSVIVSRSGYTTIMDLAALEKKAYFIPTPGQYEQKYLAKRLKNLDLVPYCKQEDFTFEKLKQVRKYKGLSSFKVNPDFDSLFSLFESK